MQNASWDRNVIAVWIAMQGATYRQTSQLLTESVSISLPLDTNRSISRLSSPSREPSNKADNTEQTVLWGRFSRNVTKFLNTGFFCLTLNAAGYHSRVRTTVSQRLDSWSSASCRAEHSSELHSVRSSRWIQPACAPSPTRVDGLFHRGEVARAWSWPLSCTQRRTSYSATYLCPVA